MEMAIYTLHTRPGDDMRAVTDRFEPFALILPPVWAIWNRLWFTLAGMIAAQVTTALILPQAVPVVTYGIALILSLEAGSVRRLELRLSGWTEAGLAEARTPEGAEELFRAGREA